MRHIFHLGTRAREVDRGALVAVGGRSAPDSPAELDLAFCGTLTANGVGGDGTDAPLCFGHHVDRSAAGQWWTGGGQWLDAGTLTVTEMSGLVGNDTARNLLSELTRDGSLRLLVHRDSLITVLTPVAAPWANGPADNSVVVLGVDSW